MDDARDRPGKCTNCHGLIVEELLAARGFSAEFNWWRAFDEDDCETCRLLRNGIALADPPGNHEPIRKWQLHIQNGLIMKGDDNGRAVMVEFYRTSDSPAVPGAIKEQRHVVPWWQDYNTLLECRGAIESSPPLATAAPRPTRLLDLGLGTAMDSDIHLTQNTWHVSKYATLSHCWLQADSAPVETKNHNLDNHLARISFTSLSRTFQQAIRASRRLQLRYLWIDSLCIIQDNYEDWEREAANMDTIYASAAVTLAMHSTTDGAIPYRTLPFYHAGAKAQIHVRALTRHADLLHHIAAAPMAEDKDTIAPNGQWANLSLRGWCYQERALSATILHLTSAEVLLERDSRIDFCQCSHHHWRSTVGFGGWLATIPPALPDDRAKYVWGTLVRQYTQRMFSRQSDVLPGIAGLARRLGTDHQMGGYVAGLWRRNLLRWLCWRSVPWESEVPGANFCPYCRPHPRRKMPDQPPVDPAKEFVPSFSWASRFGPCEFMHDPWRAGDYVAVAEVLHAECRVRGQSPFGRVLAGFIDIRANVYRGLVFSTAGWSRQEFVRENLCLTQHAYVVDERFPERWDVSAPKEVVFGHAKGCGRRFKVDASDDLPPNGTAVFLLELFQDPFWHLDPDSEHGSETERPVPGEKAIMLVLVRDESSGMAIAANRLPDAGGLLSYRRIGIGVFGLFEFVGMEPPTLSNIRLV